MARLVKKFGGTSLGDIPRMVRAAERVTEARANGHEVCVVVSAMGGETARMAMLAEAIAPTRDAAEMDALLSSGEQASAALFAMILQDKGVDARSWQAWQIPVKTDGAHGAARIEEIGTQPLLGTMKEGGIPVITGFQGVSPAGRVTTLGRGGSDTTAMALADALDADRCDIYTDVPGVFTADPRFVTDARRIERLSYAEMDTLACFGARVMHAGSVAYARRRGLELRILSSFETHKGTTVTAEPVAAGKKRPVKAIASMGHCRAASGHTAPPAGAIPAAMGRFTAAGEGKSMLEVFAARDRETAGEFSRVLLTLVGDGMPDHKNLLDRAEKALGKADIAIEGWQEGKNYLSLIVEERKSEPALKALHAEFGLAGAA